MPVSDAVRAVYSAALRDPVVSERLHRDPEEVGREMGVRGAELAELVGSERLRASGTQQSEWTLQVLRDIVLHDLGRPWPFAELSVAELAERAAMAEVFSNRLYRSKGMGLEGFWPPADFADWATALEQEIRRRADASDRVDPVLADALVQALGLIGAAEHVGAS